MLKLAFVIPTLDQSGAEKQLSLLATQLPPDEFDVHVFALTRGGYYENLLEKHDIPVTIVGKRWKFDPLAMRRLSKSLHAFQPDVVHAWLFAANAYTRIVGGRHPSWRTIISERCVDSWKATWQIWLDRRMVARTDHLIGNSPSVVEFYGQLGYAEEQMSVIPNGVEIPDLNPDHRAMVLSELGLPPECRLIGYVGRLAEQKRVKDLLWAIQLLRQPDPNVRLIVIGDGPLRSRLEVYAKEVEAADFVRFVGHRTDVAPFFQAFDVFWLASEYEGMSNSVMEAMAAGTPVVASDITANQELVSHGDTGFLVKQGDSVGFSQFTLKILSDSELAKRLGDAGRARLANEFSIANMVERHAELYRRIVAQPDLQAADTTS